MPSDSLRHLDERLQAFADARDWPRFHTPKNLVLALAGEVGELATEVQWLTDAEAHALHGEALRRVEDEMADVLIYLVRLARTLGVDLVDAAHSKTDRNEVRFPAPSDSRED